MMKHKKYTSLLLLTIFTPYLAHAQTAATYLETFALFLRNVIMPFLFAVAFLFFLINLTRYFIVEGASEDSRAMAKRNSLWGILAFVFLFSLWTIVTLALSSLNLTEREAACPDYMEQFGFGGLCNQDSGQSTTSSFPSSLPGSQ